jgi:hypothetical protein
MRGAAGAGDMAPLGVLRAQRLVHECKAEDVLGGTATTRERRAHTCGGVAPVRLVEERVLRAVPVPAREDAAARRYKSASQSAAAEQSSAVRG